MSPENQHNQIISRSHVRQVDQIAIEKFGIPGIALMENASRALVECVLSAINQCQHRRVLIICGSGNNGGDGFAAARHLHNAGIELTILCTKTIDQYDGDARTNLDIINTMRLNVITLDQNNLNDLAEWCKGGIILDCLLGTGLQSEVKQPLCDLIQWVNDQTDVKVIAADIPSGLDCDSGLPLGIAVKADATVSFVAIKKGFIQPGAEVYTGKITVGDIGVPIELVESLLEIAD